MMAKKKDEQKNESLNIKENQKTKGIISEKG